MTLKVTDAALQAARGEAPIALADWPNELLSDVLAAAAPHLAYGARALPILETRWTLTERHDYELWRDAALIAATASACRYDDILWWHRLLMDGPPKPAEPYRPNPRSAPAHETSTKATGSGAKTVSAGMSSRTTAAPPANRGPGGNCGTRSGRSPSRPTGAARPDGRTRAHHAQSSLHSPVASAWSGTRGGPAPALPRMHDPHRAAAGYTRGGPGLPDDQVIIWCDLNAEQDAIERALTAAGLSFSSIHGGLPLEEQERRLEHWRDRRTYALIGKPVMLGQGVNLQQCNKAVFVGVTHKFNDLIQACPHTPNGGHCD